MTNWPVAAPRLANAGASISFAAIAIELGIASFAAAQPGPAGQRLQLLSGGSGFQGHGNFSDRFI